jgi:uncharacterized protein (TIGR01777 family)
MNYLISGGTGLIGHNLITALANEGNRITVLTRNKYKAKKLLGSNIKLIEHLSIDDIENQNTIINLAGEPIADRRWTDSQKKKICQSRWDITKKLAELINLAKNPPSLFISGSAIGIYGRQADTPIDESFTQFHQEFTHEVCSRWEALALEAKSDVTRVVILRTGIVLDPESGALAKMLLPFKLGLGGKICNGQQIMSWIHIDDMISAILHIKDTPTIKGAINITANNPVTNADFSQNLAKVLQRPFFFTTPAVLLKIVFGEMADLLLFGQNVVPRKLINSGFNFKYPTIDNALKNLLNKEPSSNSLN